MNLLIGIYSIYWSIFQNKEIFQWKCTVFNQEKRPSEILTHRSCCSIVFFWNEWMKIQPRLHVVLAQTWLMMTNNLWHQAELACLRCLNHQESSSTTQYPKVSQNKQLFREIIKLQNYVYSSTVCMWDVGVCWHTH